MTVVEQLPSTRSNTERGGSPLFSDFSSSLETNGQALQPLVSAEVESGRIEFSIEPITPAEEKFRHSGWRLQRRQVFAALKATGQTRNRLQAFCYCGSGCRVQYNHELKELRYVSNHCHDRFCVPCGTARAAKISRHVLANLPAAGVRFITLTLRHNRIPLSQQITRCLECWKQLRRRSIWLNHVEGGVGFLELKLSERDHLWHVHLHILALGSFFPQKDLSAEWYAVTGDSSVVHIEIVRDPGKVAGYVAKYSAKPLDAWTAGQTDCLQEIVLALKGRRLFTTFGSWRGVDLDPSADAVGEWRDLGSLDQLISDARTGDAQAVRVFEAICRSRPWMLESCGPPERITTVYDEA